MPKLFMITGVQCTLYTCTGYSLLHLQLRFVSSHQNDNVNVTRLRNINDLISSSELKNLRN